MAYGAPPATKLPFAIEPDVFTPPKALFPSKLIVKL